MEADEYTGDERYRLEVMAGSVTEAVSCAGGWLFDRALSGWDTTVFVAQCPGDVRPLHVLGAKAVELESALSGPERLPAALSVSAELYAENDTVRRAVRIALGRRTAEVTVWGVRHLPELRCCIEPVEHHLSNAARIYKLHALGAAGVHLGAVDDVEHLGRVQRNPRAAQGIRYMKRPTRPDVGALPQKLTSSAQARS